MPLKSGRPIASAAARASLQVQNGCGFATHVALLQQHTLGVAVVDQDIKARHFFLDLSPA
jgi:hypothetical protein